MPDTLYNIAQVLIVVGLSIATIGILLIAISFLLWDMKG